MKDNHTATMIALAAATAFTFLMTCGSESLGWSFTWFLAFMSVCMPFALRTLFDWMSTTEHGELVARMIGADTDCEGDGDAEDAEDFELAMPAVRSGEHGGWRWLIARNPIGGCNGYVHVPEGNRMREYAEPDKYLAFGWQSTGGLLDLPSEITYASPYGDGWIGFDTMHADDIWAEGGEIVYDYSCGLFPPRVWNVDRVQEACEETIDRIREYTGETE